MCPDVIGVSSRKATLFSTFIHTAPCVLLSYLVSFVVRYKEYLYGALAGCGFVARYNGMTKGRTGLW